MARRAGPVNVSLPANQSHPLISESWFGHAARPLATEERRRAFAERRKRDREAARGMGAL